ncbi:nitroreductase family protein [Eggerthella sp. YY7918]|uniref:nitroreductase family protein n=1 Tax=Eggerthella sp. (strain YY7918) TaxID=502558 RepID=UPI0002171044|nr:nitroreductase family protein [Eggerthella sp. YY7918]BAK43827.1 hypothetical protein EGYY_06160 [Eggerthella sp. YY7918]
MKHEHTVLIDASACIGCGLCQKDCCASNISLENGKAHIVSPDCLMCGHCVAICPKGAVSLTGFAEAPQPFDAPTRLDPHELLQAIRTRRTIRQFAERSVPPETIERIIEAGRLTPTGGNAQEVTFAVLQEGREVAERKAVQLFRRLLPLVKLVDTTAKRTTIDDHFFFKKAPVAIVVIAPDTVDGALAASNMALMAEACGLGVLYSGFFTMAANRVPSLRALLGLHRKRKAVATLVLGYPAVTYRRTAPKEEASVRTV